VGLRAGLDAEARGKTFVPSGDRTPVVQPVVRHYTDGEISGSHGSKYEDENLLGYSAV
jgi:hypothetical protein